MIGFYWIRRIFWRDGVSVLMKWAKESGAKISLSSNVNPKTFDYEVIICARNVRYYNPYVGETFISARGGTTDEAAREFMRKVNTEKHFITETEAAK